MSARGTEDASSFMRAKVKRLQLEFRRDQEALIHCVDRIDDRLLRCGNQVDEYNETVSVLVGLNERLANLAGSDSAFIACWCQQSRDLILARVEALKVKSET